MLANMAGNWQTGKTGKMPANYSYNYYHKLLSIVSSDSASPASLWSRWAYVSYTFLTGRLSVRGKCRVPCAFKAHLCQSRSLCAHQCIKLYICQCVCVCVCIWSDCNEMDRRVRREKEEEGERPQWMGMGACRKCRRRAEQMMSVDVNEYCSHSARKLKAPPEVAIFVRAVKAAVVIPCA